MKKISASILKDLCREAKNHDDAANLNAVIENKGAKGFWHESVKNATSEQLFETAKNRLEAIGVTVYGK